MFVTNWISTTKIQKISEITNFFRHYFLSRTEVVLDSLAIYKIQTDKSMMLNNLIRYQSGKYLLGLSLDDAKKNRNQ